MLLVVELGPELNQDRAKALSEWLHKMEETVSIILYPFSKIQPLVMGHQLG